MIGPPEILIIALVVLLIFGASAIPKFAKSLGEARREFKKGMAESESNAVEDEKKETSE